MPNEQINEDLKRKNWTPNDWKKSDDETDKLIIYIWQLSPWNLWKARGAIRSIFKKIKI